MSDAKQSPPSSTATMLGAIALVVACGHLAYAMVSEDDAGPSPTAQAEAKPSAGASTDSSDRYREEMNALRKEVQELRREVEQLRSMRVQRTGDVGGGGLTPADRLSPDFPVFTEAQLAKALPGESTNVDANSTLIGIPAGIEASVGADGRIKAVAIDESLRGKAFIVATLGPDGKGREIRVTAE